MPHRQRNCCNREHQAASLRPVPQTLGPEVLAGEGAAPVCLNVPDSIREIQMLAVQFQHAFQGVSHADNAVGTLHSCKKSERPHDVGPKDGKGTIAQCTLEGKIPLPDMESNSLPAKTGLPNLNVKRLP